MHSASEKQYIHSKNDLDARIYRVSPYLFIYMGDYFLEYNWEKQKVYYSLSYPKYVVIITILEL